MAGDEMKILQVLLMLLSFTAGADTLTIGSEGFFSGDPFCGDCSLSLHFQTLYLEGEIGTSATITEMGWKRTPGGVGAAVLNDFSVYMGYCSLDTLGTSFAGNYVPGTKTLVFHEDSFSISGEVGEWATKTLDTPYWYTGSGNLIIEYEWTSGSGNFYVWAWDTGANRSLLGGYGSATGSLQMHVLYQQLIGVTGSLSQMTFGEIKALQGN